MIDINILDGHRVIGGNKILVEGEDGAIMLDFGINFSSWGKYFEEFLSPRSGLMVKDLLKLELLPRFDIYRSDFTYDSDLPKLKRDILFTFLSHVHTDHMGFVGLLKENIPILSSAETLAMAIAINEIHSEEKSRLILERRTPGEYPIRSDVLVKSRAKEKRELVKRTLIYSGQNKISALPISVKDIEETFEEVNVEDSLAANLVEAKILPVYHSVIGSSSLYFKLDGVRFLYTGDLRDSPSPDEERLLLEMGKNRLELANSTRKMIDLVKGKVDVLIVEGTRVKGSHSNITEATLYGNILEEIEKSRGKLVIADFPLRHLERFHTFLKVANETGREFVVLPKDYLLLSTMAVINSDWKFQRYVNCIRVYHQGKSSWNGWENKFLNGKIFNDPPLEKLIIHPSEIEKDPGSYILNLGYFELSNLLDFSTSILNGGIYIHSNSETYTEDQVIDSNRLLNWLEYFNIEPKGIKKGKDKTKPSFTGNYHASGHISPEGLENLIEEVNPAIIIPVHSESPEWFSERWKEKVRLDHEVYI